MKSASTMPATMARQPRPDAERKSDAALGRRLSSLRKERGLTQVELAEMIETQQTIISDYECGRIRPNPSMLVRLAKAMQVSTDEILGMKPAETVPTLNRRLLRRIRAMEKLPKRDLDALLRTIDAVITARKSD
jgi:transcriptional regulator with XRE-family HTH domain